MTAIGAGDRRQSRDIFALVYAVFVAGLCSIIYELLIATTVSYFLGDSVRYFSLTIGLYMAAMGAGAYLSKHLQGNLILTLIRAETVLGLLGGLCVPLLYLAYAFTDLFILIYVVMTLAVGVLIGLEIPLLTRIMQRYDSLRVNLAHVLTLDYVGALIATVAFPLLLLPAFGSLRSSAAFGIINMSIGLMLLWRFSDRVPQDWGRRLTALSTAIIVVLAGTLLAMPLIMDLWTKASYDGKVVHNERSRYQRIVLTRHRDDLRLYLDGNLQFSSLDEYRYHEALVHVPMAIMAGDGRQSVDVLLLGGGDGLAVRELLKHERIRSITLVDLDPAITRLARDNKLLGALNEQSLTRDERVRVINADAYSFLAEPSRLFDVILADLPDPNNTELARLYAREFYQRVHRALDHGGVFVTQATSPLYAREAFWTVHDTVADVFATTLPYHLLVPSFGEWGFVLASDVPSDLKVAKGMVDVPTRFLDAGSFMAMFRFDKDQGPLPVEVSTFDRPVILRRYLDGWRNWGR